MSLTRADLFAALDELAAAGIIEWPNDDAGRLVIQTLHQPSGDELVALSHVAVAVWLTLCRLHRDLENQERAGRN